VPAAPARPAALKGRVFRGTDVVAKGLLTGKQLRSSAWVRLRQDVYADAELPVDHRLLVSAVGLSLPGGGGFAGRSAAVLWGVKDVATTAHPVEVVLPPGRRWNAGPGVRVRSLRPGQLLVSRGKWPCTGRIDTALDLLRWSSGNTDDAVIMLDRLVHVGLVSLFDVREAVERLPPCRGSGRTRRAARLADGQAESPPETRLRLVMMRAGLPMPVAQFRVFDDDGLIGRVDFAYPDLKIAIEYDGAWHGEPGLFSRDRTRLNRLRAAGWTVLHVTAADRYDPLGLVAQVRSLINTH
jgi:G:T-mismatch repair DNA endonuclease (very short patch repair protein)